jgi:ferredoxin--NADP+ reductase
MFPILKTEALSPTIRRFVVKAPLVARKREAGHFVIIRVCEGGERIPLTIVDSDPAEGTITLIVQAVGKTTRLLCAKGAGESIRDVLGPLGNPTPILRCGAVACVGGGVGTAELLPIARELHAAGNVVHAVIGARTRDLIILEKELASFAESLVVATDDGSYGRPGLVTEPLADLLAAPLGIGAVYAIGPLPMMKAVASVTKPHGVRTLVSLNAIMVDGTGMCGGCRVSVDGEMRFACVDGPEFDAQLVDFDELMRRNRTYSELETRADERFRNEAVPDDVFVPLAELDDAQRQPA